ncbi:MAG: T9SS type A sorting domain-containing protein, partial [Bacteroidota bacterium]
GLTYQWKKGNGNIGGATNINYTATTGGTYKVVVTNANTCSKTSAGTVVTINCRLSGEENEAAGMEVFPNPANGMVTLKYTASQNQSADLILTDLTGREVMHEQINMAAGTNENTFDISGFTNGVYFIKIKTIDGERVQKIVKQ